MGGVIEYTYQKSKNFIFMANTRNKEHEDGMIM